MKGLRNVGSEALRKWKGRKQRCSEAGFEKRLDPVYLPVEVESLT